MKKITLRVPDEMADMIEKFANESKGVTSVQQAYRHFLQSGIDAENGNNVDKHMKLLEFVSNQMLQSSHYSWKIYRAMFDSKQSKFDNASDEREWIAAESRKAVNDILGKGENNG